MSKCLKSSIAVFLLLLQTSNSLATVPDDVPLVRSSNLSEEEFFGFAEAHHEIRLSDYLDQRRPLAVSQKRLKHLMEEAQTAFLSESPKESKRLFLQISQMAQVDDWRDAEREAIQYSELRLAQLSDNPVDRGQHLFEAARLFGDITPDLSLFPPPLIQSFKKEVSKQNESSQVFFPYDVFPNHQIILIDGRRVHMSATTKVTVTPGIHRIRALSDSHPSVTENATVKQLTGFRAVSTPLVSGTCTKPNLEAAFPSTETIEFRALFEHDCVRVDTENGWIAEGSELSLQRGSGRTEPKPEDTINRMLGDMNENRTASTTKETWLWIGGSALLAGLAYVAYNQLNQQHDAKQQTPMPVKHEGF
jgi:hypothetical protein